MLQDPLLDELLTQLPGQAVLGSLLELHNLPVICLQLSVILQHSDLDVEWLGFDVGAQVGGDPPHVAGRSLVVVAELIRSQI